MSSGPSALEELDGLLDLEGGADRVAEGLVHVGDKRDAAALHRAADPGHRPGQLLRLLQVLDERPVAPLDVDHEALGTLGEFPRKNAAGDERQAGNRSRFLAQLVEFGVGGGEVLDSAR